MMHLGLTTDLKITLLAVIVGLIAVGFRVVKWFRKTKN